MEDKKNKSIGEWWKNARPFKKVVVLLLGLFLFVVLQTLLIVAFVKEDVKDDKPVDYYTQYEDDEYDNEDDEYENEETYDDIYFEDELTDATDDYRISDDLELIDIAGTYEYPYLRFAGYIKSKYESGTVRIEIRLYDSQGKWINTVMPKVDVKKGDTEKFEYELYWDNKGAQDIAEYQLYWVHFVD